MCMKNKCFCGSYTFIINLSCNFNHFFPWMRLIICAFCGFQSICSCCSPGKWLNYNIALEDSLMSYGKLGKTFYWNTIMLKYHIFPISVLSLKNYYQDHQHENRSVLPALKFFHFSEGSFTASSSPSSLRAALLPVRSHRSTCRF